MSANSAPAGSSTGGADRNTSTTGLPNVSINRNQVARLRGIIPHQAMGSQNRHLLDGDVGSSRAVGSQGHSDRDVEMNHGVSSPSTVRIKPTQTPQAAETPSDENPLGGIQMPEELQPNQAWNQSDKTSSPTPDTLAAVIQSVFQNPTVLSSIQHASAPTPNQIVALSTSIVHQISEQLSKKIDEQVEEQLRHRLQGTPPSSNSTPRRHEDPQGAEVSDDSVANVCGGGRPHRRTRDITPADHQFNIQIQGYLKGKGLWCSPRDAILSPPPPEDIEDYQEQRHNCRCPAATEPRFDWNRVLPNPKQCRWNSDLLTLLAQEFKGRMEATIENIREEEGASSGCYSKSQKNAKSTPFDLLNLDPAKLTIPALRVALDRRLARTKTAYLEQQPPFPGSRETPDEKKKKVEEKHSAMKKRDRTLSRRRGLYQNRKAVVKNRRNTNPSLWGDIGTLVAELGERGMSEDETDLEGYGVQVKEVRRVRAGWRNPNIVKILDYVDVTGNGKFQGAGNKSYVRHRETKSDSVDLIESTKGVPVNLPLNYYDTSWRNALTEGQGIAMQFGPIRPLPDVDQMAL